MYHDDEEDDGLQPIGSHSNHRSLGHGIPPSNDLNDSAGQYEFHQPPQNRSRGELEGNDVNMDTLRFMHQTDPDRNGGAGRRVDFGAVTNGTNNNDSNHYHRGQRAASMFIGSQPSESELSGGRGRRGVDTSSLSPPMRVRPSIGAIDSDSLARAPLTGGNVGVGVFDQGDRSQGSSPAGAPAADPQGGGQDSGGAFLPTPYQSMFQQENAEDPTVARARSLMLAHKDSRRQLSKQPEATAGIPAEPKAPPIEPSTPAPRLGRRIIQSRKRIPDIHKGTLVGPAEEQKLRAEMEQGSNVVVCVVTCGECGAPLKINKAAIMVQCPDCERTILSACCHV